MHQSHARSAKSHAPPSATVFVVQGVVAEGSSGRVLLAQRADDGKNTMPNQERIYVPGYRPPRHSGGVSCCGASFNAESDSSGWNASDADDSDADQSNSQSSFVSHTMSTPAVQVAVKIIPRNGPAFIADQAEAEIEIMRACCNSSPFIVRFEFLLQLADRIVIGMEYCSGGDLFNLMNVEALQPTDVMFYAAELTLALEHLHSRNILHCDLKPENIALAADGHLRLIDFGLSVILSPEFHTNSETGRMEVLTQSGTLPYCAPEILRRVPHGPESDWWSFAVIIYEMLFGCLPWFTEDDQETCIMICTAPLETPEPQVPDMLCFDLICHMLAKDRDSRLAFENGAGEIKAHPWFSGVDWGQVAAQTYKPPFALHSS